MSLKIIELFGYSPTDHSKEASEARRSLLCPFLGGKCTKTLSRDGTVSGVCTVKPATSEPVIICPNRLYADNYKILQNIAIKTFGEGMNLIPAQKMHQVKHDGKQVVVFGKRWGKELKLPTRGRQGRYFVDWVLAHIGENGQLKGFLPVEVQSMDTTGNYRAEREAYMRGEDYEGYSVAGINWENVSKRILPQLIYKGNVLRRERLCTNGLFFVCPTPVYERVMERLAREMMEYTNLQPGSLTFVWYDVGLEVANGSLRTLEFKGQYSTTIDQVALAFTAPVNLPDPNVYEEAIKSELNNNK